MVFQSHIPVPVFPGSQWTASLAWRDGAMAASCQDRFLLHTNGVLITANLKEYDTIWYVCSDAQKPLESRYWIAYLLHCLSWWRSLLFSAWHVHLNPQRLRWWCLLWRRRWLWVSVNGLWTQEGMTLKGATMNAKLHVESRVSSRSSAIGLDHATNCC